MHNRRWAIYNSEGTQIILKMRNADTGEIEDLEFYANEEVAHVALDMMDLHERINLGAHVREVAQS